MKIYAARYENSLSSPALLETFKRVEGLGLRWNIYEFGLQRAEFTAVTRDRYNLHDRIRDHLGQRIILFTPQITRPISGWVSEARIAGPNQIQYVIKGPAWRGLYSELDVTEYATTDTVSATITTILNDHVSIDDGTSDNIASNSTQLGGWQPDHPQGTYPGDAFKELIAKSDSNNAVYDFWLLDQIFNYITPQLYTPYYVARSDSASVNWRVKLADLSQLTFARNIDEFATTVHVYYGLVTGTATGGSHTQLQDTSADFLASGVRPDDQVTHITAGGRDRVVSVDSATQLTLNSISAKSSGTATGGSATTLVDTAADFVADGVRANDKVFNDTDGSTGTVTSVATTTVTCSGGFSGGSTNAFAASDKYRVASRFQSGDSYAIKTKATVNRATATTSTTNYWSKEIAVFEPSMDQTQAQQYATVLANDSAEQVQSFTISSAWIRDSVGARHPLFDVIAEGGGYIQIEDLYPTSVLFSTSRDKLTTFFITALDYDARTNRLRVMVDKPDRRLDIRLRRAGILSSEGIAR